VNLPRLSWGWILSGLILILVAGLSLVAHDWANGAAGQVGAGLVTGVVVGGVIWMAQRRAEDMQSEAAQKREDDWHSWTKRQQVERDKDRAEHQKALVRLIAQMVLMQGHTLKGLDLSNQDLEEFGSFQERVILACKFNGSNLQNSEWRGCDIKDSSFVNARLSEADFSGGSFLRVNFRGAQLARAKVRNATFSHCSFDSADLTHMDRSQARFNDCSGLGGE